MKRAVAIATAITAFSLAAPASAIELGTPASEHPYRSAQNFALELRFSSYKPQIDDEPGLANKPYENTFGGRRLMVGLEFDWQTFRIPHIGTLGPGLGVGYVGMSADAKTASGVKSGDETSLAIYPFWGVAVFRADGLWHDRGFPFIPYAKAGLGYAIWSASNSGGTSRAPDSSGNVVVGRGGSWGTNFALGISFALDAIDAGASRNMDNATGINNTLFFFEAYWLTLNGIAQSNALRVGSNAWAMGLTFEF